MTPTLENLDQRVTVLEERMDQEAGLRASQDRDLSEMAATVKTNKDLLQALATTQSEHTQKLDRLDHQMGEMRGQMGEMLNGMGEMRGEVSELRSEMGRVQDGMQQIVGMLDTLIAREHDQ